MLSLSTVLKNRGTEKGYLGRDYRKTHKIVILKGDLLDQNIRLSLITPQLKRIWKTHRNQRKGFSPLIRNYKTGFANVSLVNISLWLTSPLRMRH